jgi:hypothetical protein
VLAILVAQKAEIRKILVQSQFGTKSLQDPISKKKKKTQYKKSNDFLGLGL